MPKIKQPIISRRVKHHVVVVLINIIGKWDWNLGYLSKRKQEERE